MYDTFGKRRGIAERVYVRHDVMAEFFLIFGCFFIINRSNIIFHFINLRVRNLNTQFFFRFRQSDPQLTPSGKLIVG
ncbi:hypothetical protein SDC9_212230 [bioreactor metagenome]|uniref:Uncharacterized protein n=1 Tax=bioreactor metagenome TaxID=1076179 RepID=A0A645JLA8_9ZZZZ